MLKVSSPFFIRYPEIVFDKEPLLDMCWQAILDDKWAHYHIANPGLGYSDLLLEVPPCISKLFRKKIWNWSNITWVHRNGYQSPHVHNGQTAMNLQDDVYKDNPTALQIKEWMGGEELKRAPTSVALFFPLLGMGHRSPVNTIYYDGQDPSAYGGKDPDDLVEVAQHSLICPTLIRVDLWHSVHNLNAPNRFQLMLNFNDPITLEEANELILDNLV